MVNNLGLLYVDQGKLVEAEQIYERALRGKEAVLGPKHTSTRYTVGHLGILYKNQGKLPSSEFQFGRFYRNILKYFFCSAWDASVFEQGPRFT